MLEQYSVTPSTIDVTSLEEEARTSRHGACNESRHRYWNLGQCQAMASVCGDAAFREVVGAPNGAGMRTMVRP